MSVCLLSSSPLAKSFKARSLVSHDLLFLKPCFASDSFFVVSKMS